MNFLSPLYDTVWNMGAAAWPVIEAAPAAVWKILDSNFSAALFGALAGAYGAHRIALSKERKEKLTAATDATNTAIGLSNIIANNFLTAKRQHIIGLLERYERQFQELGQVEHAAMHGGGPMTFAVLADFRTLTVPSNPINALEEVVQKIGPAISAGSIVQSLKQSIEYFNLSLDRRMQIILQMVPLREDIKALRYYGLLHDNRIDDSYPDVMLALRMQCDDCIYFSMLLGEVLVKHGNQLPDLLRRKEPRVVRLVYDNIPQNVLPDRSEYHDFERQYRTPPKDKPKPTLWTRLARAVSAFLGAD